MQPLKNAETQLVPEHPRGEFDAREANPTFRWRSEIPHQFDQIRIGIYELGNAIRGRVLEEFHFQKQIEQLVKRFEAELDAIEWATRRYSKRFRDETRNEQYDEVHALYLQKGPTKLLLHPIGFDIPGCEAAANI